MKTVSYIIYFYMFIGLSLLVFNMAYIARSKRQARRNVWWRRAWEKRIRRQMEHELISALFMEKHFAVMEKQLQSIPQLTAYHDAVMDCMEQDPDVCQQYLNACAMAFQRLAIYYGRRDAMERAYFAYLMSVYHPAREKGGQITEILLGYLEDSTVFCRENVLQALFAMGKSAPVETALSMMNERGWYHHNRLLSDGLMTFAGDKVALAKRLWKSCGKWNEVYQVAVIQFAANLSDDFSASFYEALRKRNLPQETYFALIRYFQRHPYPPAEEVLIGLLEEDGQRQNGDFAIAAAAALAKYPSGKTKTALLEAIHSRNWHTRRNAASSLLSIGLTREDVRYIKDRGDRYAIEMMLYMIKEKGYVYSN